METMSAGLSQTETVGLVESALRSHANKTVELPAKIGVHAYKGAESIAMPAHIKGMHAIGCKWISDSPNNYRYNLPYLTGLIVINDPETCVPLAVMDSSWITKIRTAAVTVIAARHLARKDSHTMGLIGAGVQGRANSIAICQLLRDIREVKVFDVRDEAVKRSVGEIEEELNRSIDVRSVKSVRDAVERSDVVVTATAGVTAPLVQTDWFKRGVFFAPLDDWRIIGLGAISKFDKFVTDDWEQTRSFMRKESRTLPKLHAELGEIVAGRKPGRERTQDRIIEMSLGLAIHDVAVAKRIYELAQEKGIGTQLRLDMCD